MLLATLLEHAAHRYPEVEALVESERRLTYRQWNHRVDCVASALIQAGIRAGDRIGLCGANSEALATMFFAGLKMGAIAVPLSTRWKAAELAYALHDADIRAVFFDRHTSDAMNRAIDIARRPLLRICTDDSVVSGDDIRRFEDLASHPPNTTWNRKQDASDIAMILYTSGTLGRPKAVPRTHLNDYTGLLAMIVAHGWERFERTLAIMPFYHVMGLHTLLAMVILNGTCVFEPTFSPTQVVKTIEKERLTALYLVPTAYHDIINVIEKQGGMRHKVSKLAYAGAPMSAHLVQRCQAHFRPEIFVNHYGCTEAQIISVNPAVPKKPGSAGRPAINTRVRIVVADRSRAVSPNETVPPGRQGEIIVEARSPQVFSGYMNRPDATSWALRDGWYFTGDLGWFDADGDLMVDGRADDMIVSGGENIHPTEVEALLSRHPGILDVAVVGLPDERWGQMVTAFVVPAVSELDACTLDTYCISHSELARFKRPRRYVFVDSIPKSPTGKVLRAHLRAGHFSQITPPSGSVK